MKRYAAWFGISFLWAAISGADGLSLAEQKEFDAVKPGQTIVFDADDSEALRVAKATKCVPTPRQVVWQELEFTCFIHFGINTFTGREWGNGKEKPTLFNPPKVDTDQWCRTAKEAGMKMMMITVKHHDGYCTWQTHYNDDFSIKKSPWKKGKGDLFRQLSESCKKYGLKLGVYLSPADLYQIENKKGLYGNLSSYRESVIPTDPATFTTNPLKKRSVPAKWPTFKFKVDDYNRYMLNQLYELLTEYGPVHEVWFDGATPKSKGGQKYTRAYWSELIRTLAPNAVIAIKGPDVRWCGNEHGGTRRMEWSPVAITGEPKDWKMNDMKGQDLGSRARLKNAGFVQWYPSEVDVSIRHGWFWRNEKQGLRSPEVLFDIYERAVGGNSVMLLNVPPSREGVFAPRDVATLKAIGQRIKATYGKPLVKLTQNGNIYTFEHPAIINRCVLMEDIAKEGQRIEKIALDAWVDGDWKEISKVDTVGYKRILRFPDIRTSKIRVRILEQRLTAKLSYVAVHFDLAPLKTPAISRSYKGEVKLNGNGTIHYTTDGSKPTASSVVYTKPFALPSAGTINAVAYRGDEASAISTERFDIIKTKWKIVEVSSENAAKKEAATKAIDDNRSTFWFSKPFDQKKSTLPQYISIDFGEALNLKGFSYLPYTVRRRGGIVDQYKIELSRDGKKWVKVDEGRFDNIANNPTLREIRFKQTYSKIRYLRFTAQHATKNHPYCAVAEIGVITN